MKRVLLELEQRYGSWRKEKNYLFNCVLTRYSSSIYLNVLFNEPEYKKNIEYLKSQNIEIDNSIKGFYEAFNGITLFSHSLVIFGYVNSLERGYTPLNMESMNVRIKAKNRQWDCDYCSIGEYSKFDFCLKRRDKQGTIYVINRFDNRLVRTFPNLDSLLEYAVSKLMQRYDQSGLKLGSPEQSKNWMDNMSLEEDLFD